tara:strand:- start:945 stop:1952 length:1008 start_codon:yes stop_codon:yes gene_type:complete
MPNSWKKNAKYFNSLDMSHDEYVTKKKKFRKWKKNEGEKGEPFIDSQYLFVYPSKYQYEPDSLSENDKSMYSLYISKQHMKKSNSTFRKRGMGNMTRPSHWRKRQKENRNKYTRYARKHDKVYYNIDNYIKTIAKNSTKQKVDTGMCSICCETKSIKELFTVHCKGKRIGSFKKNQDKIICNECKSKVNTCPYCRSHNLKYVKYKRESRKYSITSSAVQQWKRKKQTKIILNNVSEFEWRKRARKKMYPNKLLWVSDGKVTIKKNIKQWRWREIFMNSNIVRSGGAKPIPLPLKLYKFYLNKNIEYTHFKNIDDEVYETYDEIPEREYYIGSIKV